jgi:FkbM family methyltransferase
LQALSKIIRKSIEEIHLGTYFTLKFFLAKKTLSITADLMASMMLSATSFENVGLLVLKKTPDLPFLRSFKWHIQQAFKNHLENSPHRFRWIRLATSAYLLVDIVDLLGFLYFQEGGFFERTTTNFLIENLRAGEVFIDVGANCGYYSIMAASIVGEAGKVYAFEPNPEISQLLEKSATKNGFKDRIFLFNLALSDRESESANLYVSQELRNSGLSSLNLWESHRNAGWLADNKVIKIQTSRFDTWMKSVSLTRIDMMKIDVEGAELEMINGMEETLRNLRPRCIICETHLDNPVVSYLQSLNYDATPLELDSNNNFGNILFTLK